jgi:hypothetical protein
MNTSSVFATIVVLGLPQVVAAIIVRMNVILNAMLANKTTFPSPPVPLATAQTHLAALVSAEAALKSKPPTGVKQVRNDALLLVKQDAQQLHGYVQTLCNASPSQAATIAANAAMTLRKKGAHPKADIAVKQKISGTVHVSARSIKGAKSHEWQLSSDGGKTWTAVPPTSKPSTTISGITPGQTVLVRHRIVTTTDPTDWIVSSPVAVS